MKSREFMLPMKQLENRLKDLTLPSEDQPKLIKNLMDLAMLH
jgi:hypothetical protein